MLGFPFGSSFDQDAYLDMIASMLMRYPSLPHAAVSYTELMEMDVDLFLRLREMIQDAMPT